MSPAIWRHRGLLAWCVRRMWIQSWLAGNQDCWAFDTGFTIAQKCLTGKRKSSNAGSLSDTCLATPFLARWTTSSGHDQECPVVGSGRDVPLPAIAGSRVGCQAPATDLEVPHHVRLAGDRRTRVPTRLRPGRMGHLDDANRHRQAPSSDTTSPPGR